jgi:hypothetical protein
MKALLFESGFLLALILAVPASGQVFRQAAVAVPFEFAIGDATLPGGTYVVLTLSSAHMLQVKNVEKGISIYIYVLEKNLSLNTQGLVAPENKLVFRRDGDHYVLHQVVFAGEDHIHDLRHGTEIPELEQTQP